MRRGGNEVRAGPWNSQAQLAGTSSLLFPVGAVAPAPAPARAIRHDEATHRFEWTEDGQLCVLDYVLDGAVASFTHTGVPAAVGGRATLVGPIAGAFIVNGAKSWLTVAFPEF